ncbi:MAG: DUF3108 domain-containing protein [Maritimibacter sp.]
MRPIALVVTLILLLIPAPGFADQFEVRLYGVPVGNLHVSQTLKNGRYSASAQFRTKGLVGALRKVAFEMKARGDMKNGAFRALHYSEDMNTGERESRETVAFKKGGARMDPLTALLVGLEPRTFDTGCKVNQVVFDGKRTHRFTLSTKMKSPQRLICKGQFVRLKGYSPAQLRQLKAYDFTAQYEREGESYVFISGRARTLHGPVTIVRQ